MNMYPYVYIYINTYIHAYFIVRERYHIYLCYGE